MKSHLNNNSEKRPETEYDHEESNISEKEEQKLEDDLFSPIRKTLIEPPKLYTSSHFKGKAFTPRRNVDDPLKYQNILKYYSRPKTRQ